MFGLDSDRWETQADWNVDGDGRPSGASELGGPHTDRLILRPSVTSSGSTRRKSRMQAWLSTSLPREESTVGRTSFQSIICIARMARHTHSWTRTGFGPGANFFRRTRTWSRRAGRSLSGTWVARSYVIWQQTSDCVGISQRPGASSAHTLPFSVVAVKSHASGSAADWRMAMAMFQASFCRGNCQGGAGRPAMRGTPTERWNLNR